MSNLSSRVLEAREVRFVRPDQAAASRWIVVAITALVVFLAVASQAVGSGSMPASDVSTALPPMPAAQDVFDAATEATDDISAPAATPPTTSAAQEAVGVATETTEDIPAPAPAPPSQPATATPAPPSQTANQGESEQPAAVSAPSEDADASDSAGSHESTPPTTEVPAATPDDAEPPDGALEVDANTSIPSQQAAGAGQSSSTSQSAGSSATTVQIAPINIVIPILIGSSGTVYVANIASSWSSANNSSTTVQVSPEGGNAGPGSGPGGASAVPSSVETILEQLAGVLGVNIDLNLNWDWNWDWDWNWTWDGGWNFGSGDDPGASVDTAGPSASATGRSAAPRAESFEASPPVAQLSAADRNRLDASRGASSSIVQIPPPQPRFPAADPPVPAPSPAGGISTLMLLLGVLAALLVQFGSASGVLGRRLSLAGAGWLRQAYLAPLQRPG